MPKRFLIFAALAALTMVLTFPSVQAASDTERPIALNQDRAPVAASGQLYCYEVGDDGWYQAGVSVEPRFTDNRDGTVTDNLTGLYWLQNPNCFFWRTWSEALEAANYLSDGQCGLTDASAKGDWRLPNIKELKSLLDYGPSPGGLPSPHPFSTTPRYTLWSSTTPPPHDDEDHSTALVVHFSSSEEGQDEEWPKYSDAHVWPVRGETSGQYPAPVAWTGQPVSYEYGDDGWHGMGMKTGRFTDNGDGTVADDVTGLIWLKRPHCMASQPWTAALQNISQLADGSCYLSDGSVAGDWRLPSIKEFQSLVSYFQDGFLPIPLLYYTHRGRTYWTSTSRSHDVKWTVSLESGLSVSMSQQLPVSGARRNYVWPVRGGQ